MCWNCVPKLVQLLPSPEEAPLLAGAKANLQPHAELVDAFELSKGWNFSDSLKAYWGCINILHSRGLCLTQHNFNWCFPGDNYVFDDTRSPPIGCHEMWSLYMLCPAYASIKSDIVKCCHDKCLPKLSEMTHHCPLSKELYDYFKIQQIIQLEAKERKKGANMQKFQSSLTCKFGTLPTPHPRS